MSAKHPAAIIAGTIASPSNPSVRLTAFDAPVMTMIANGTKPQPRLISTFLKNGTASEVPSVPRVRNTMAMAPTPEMTISASSFVRPDMPREDRRVSFW